MTYQAISVTWDDDTQSVILIQFPHSWDIDDFIQAFDIAHSMMAEAEHTVHLISVLPRQFTIPPRLLLNLPAIFESIPVNSGTHFVIGGGMIIKTLLGVSCRVFPHLVSNIKLIDSIETAREQILAATNAHLASR